MNKKIRFYLIVLFFSGIIKSYGGNGTAITGNWASVSTWLINGVHRAPNCGDTLTIPSGITVTFNSQQNYSACSQKMIIIVNGTFQFTNGNKLTLPCNSVVYLMTGGLIQKATAGGGNSTYIDICGNVEWKAGDGPITGPLILGDNSLPVSLLNFNARISDKKILINWSTASEINNEYFTVDRSENGADYNEIFRIHGAGNSNVTLQYNCIDYNYPSGIIYYRLSQTDYDGNSKLYPPVALKTDSRENLQIISVNNYENNLNVIFSCDASQELSLLIYDTSGREIFSKMISSEEGINQKEVDMKKKLTGLNLIKLISNKGFSVSRKFITE